MHAITMAHANFSLTVGNAAVAMDGRAPPARLPWKLNVKTVLMTIEVGFQLSFRVLFSLIKKINVNYSEKLL